MKQDLSPVTQSHFAKLATSSMTGKDVCKLPMEFDRATKRQTRRPKRIGYSSSHVLAVVVVAAVLELIHSVSPPPSRCSVPRDSTRRHHNKQSRYLNPTTKK